MSCPEDEEDDDSEACGNGEGEFMDEGDHEVDPVEPCLK